jgi:hypothetical protein
MYFFASIHNVLIGAIQPEIPYNRTHARVHALSIYQYLSLSLSLSLYIYIYIYTKLDIYMDMCVYKHVHIQYKYEAYSSAVQKYMIKSVSRCLCQT